jgi:TRAP-type C4-dicarboxylate transport system substrate-binding protein
VKSVAITSIAVLAAIAAMPAPSWAADPITFKFSFPGPPNSTNLTGGLQPWADAVSADSEGTLKVQVYTGGVLASAQQTLDRVLNGVVEVGYSSLGLYGKQFQGSSVVELPGLVSSAVQGSVPLWNLYENGVLSEEYKLSKPVALFTFTPAFLQFKKPVKTLADVKGLKISVANPMGADVIQRLGAAPITMSTIDNYQALQRGLVDGALVPYTGFTQFKLQEVTNYHLEEALGASGGFVLMNKDAYAKLPAPAKAAVDKHSGRPFSALMGKALDATAAQQHGEVEKLPNHPMAHLEPAEAARWTERLKPIADEWVASVPNGAKILEAYKAELAKIGKATN